MKSARGIAVNNNEGVSMPWQRCGLCRERDCQSILRRRAVGRPFGERMRADTGTSAVGLPVRSCRKWLYAAPSAPHAHYGGVRVVMGHGTSFAEPEHVILMVDAAEGSDEWQPGVYWLKMISCAEAGQRLTNLRP